MGATKESGKNSKPSPWEWILAVASAAIVLGAIGTLLYEAVAAPAGPPEIEIVVDSILPAGAGYTVEFRVRNRGSSTAAGLVVEGELESDTGQVETSSVTIPYVPSEAERQAGLIFSHDPRRYELVIRPKGYELP